MNEEYLVEPDPSRANDEFLQNEIYRDNNVNIDNTEANIDAEANIDNTEVVNPDNAPPVRIAP